MATLSSALNYALAGLSVSAAQSAVVSRNVSSAGDENYTRKTAEIVNLPGSGPVVAQVTRNSEHLLLDRLLNAVSNASGQQVTMDALARMSAMTGDPEGEGSIAARLGKLHGALRSYEQNPASPTLSRSVVEAARAVAGKLNSDAADLSSIRTESDSGMAAAASRINSLLAQFKVANDGVVRGQGTAGELSEALDQRDAILKLLSEEVGIRTSLRPNNDVLIFADCGAVLFEGSPRSVNFSASGVLGPGSSGADLYIDGIPVTGAGATMPLLSGRIAALASVRDVLAPQLSQQLDQLAAGLINAFSEADPQIPTSLPSVEGLFTGTGVLPAANDPSTGLAGLLRINTMADPDRGGSALLIRDGGFGGAAYVRNGRGEAGFQLRIAELADALDLGRSFGIWGGLGGTTSLKDYAARSASWIEAQRQDGQSLLDAAMATRTRASNSLSRVTGVNIDQEMATLLDLEKSYQASSKVLATVNAMLSTLFEAVG